VRFFTPKNNFWDWLKETAANYKLVVDCGCGDGDLIKEMTQNKIRCLGIDPRFAIFDIPVPHDLCNQILVEEAQDCVFVQENMGCMLLACRPCHSGFPGLINDNRHKANPFFYVGFENNLKRDLDGADVDLILSNIGEEGENLYKVH
jgi:hypothetical protein